MKSKHTIKILSTAVALAMSSVTPALGGEGHGGGNGGDPVLLRTKLIKEYINTELRGDAIAYMSKLQLDTITSPTAQKALKSMLEKDVISDIRTSNYVLQISCKSIGGQEAGGAINGDLGGDICLSPGRLAELDSTKAEIVGLAIHEHAHHFGYDDKDYAIYQAVYKSVSLTNPAWSNADASTPPAPIAQPVPQAPLAGMNFVKLGPASFWMGSPKHEANRSDDEIQHQVHLTRNFEIQTTAVTQAQYIKVMGVNPSRFQKREHCPGTFTSIHGVSACPNHPVEKVSFNDVQLFVSRLNSAQRGPYTYRLPTEAEWEYAARGGSQDAYPIDSDLGQQLEHYSWYDANSDGLTHPVASLLPNSYGIYDMSGNVSHWIQDWYGEYPQPPVTDPQGPSQGTHRVLRGGSWMGSAKYARSAFRTGARPTAASSRLGFRLVRTR